MGVERAVTRWYIVRQSLQEEIVRLETKIAQSSDTTQEVENASTTEVVDVPSLQVELTKAQERLHLLGPCPRPMMG